MKRNLIWCISTGHEYYLPGAPTHLYDVLLNLGSARSTRTVVVCKGQSNGPTAAGMLPFAVLPDGYAFEDLVRTEPERPTPFDY